MAAVAATVVALPAAVARVERGLTMVQQVSRKGEVNALSTAFVREDNDAVNARKLRGGGCSHRAPPSPSCTCRRRRAGLAGSGRWPSANAAAQEAAERVAFDECRVDPPPPGRTPLAV